MLNTVEIDVHKKQQIKQALDFAHANRVPAVVIDPESINDAVVYRSIIRGKFKIICMVDWPKGERYYIDKFRGLPQESLNADGYEILLTPGDKAKCIKEIKYLSDFVKQYFTTTTEIRFVLGHTLANRDDSDIDAMLECIKQIPLPAFIRTTNQTKVSSSDGSIDSQIKILEKIKKVINVPVKISGNMTMKIANQCKLIDVQGEGEERKETLLGKPERFACSLDQAEAILEAISDKGIQKIGEALKPDLGTENDDTSGPSDQTGNHDPALQQSGEA